MSDEDLKAELEPLAQGKCDAQKRRFIGYPFEGE